MSETVPNPDPIVAALGGDQTTARDRLDDQPADPNPAPESHPETDPEPTEPASRPRSVRAEEPETETQEPGGPRYEAG